MNIQFVTCLLPETRGATNEGAARLQPPQTPQNRNLKKNKGFVDIMISNVSREFLQPKSTTEIV
jgi:hypothetical protein